MEVSTTRQQAVGSISGTSGSGSQSSVYGSGSSGDREFDSTLGHPGEDLRAGSSSHSQIGGGSGNGTMVLAREAAANQEEDSDDSAAGPATPQVVEELDWLTLKLEGYSAQETGAEEPATTVPTIVQAAETAQSPQQQLDVMADEAAKEAVALADAKEPAAQAEAEEQTASPARQLMQRSQ